MKRLRLVAFCALFFAFVATVTSQEKKDAPTKEEPKKVEDPKKVEPAPAGTNVLVWKFAKNVPFYQEMTTSTIQSITVQQQNISQNQEQTFYFKFTPLDEKDGKWTIKQEIEGVKMNVDIAGNPVKFDSTNEASNSNASTALVEFFKALKGSSFTLTVNAKDMTVEKVEGRDEFIKKLTATNKQLEQLLGKILSEEALKQMADLSFGMTPKEAKKANDKWDRAVTLNLGPMGKYVNTHKFTYSKQEGDKATLDVAIEVKYEKPGADATGETLPFKIKNADIKQAATTDKKENAGTFVFDTKLGRLDKADTSVKISGTLTLEIGGAESIVTLNQEQKTTVKASDKSVIPEKK